MALGYSSLRQNDGYGLFFGLWVALRRDIRYSLVRDEYLER